MPVLGGGLRAGVNHFTKMLAQQMRPYNVTVNALSPGPTRRRARTTTPTSRTIAIIVT